MRFFSFAFFFFFFFHLLKFLCANSLESVDLQIEFTQNSRIVNNFLLNQYSIIQFQLRSAGVPNFFFLSYFTNYPHNILHSYFIWKLEDENKWESYRSDFKLSAFLGGGLGLIYYDLISWGKVPYTIQSGGSNLDFLATLTVTVITRGDRNSQILNFEFRTISLDHFWVFWFFFV